MAKSDKKAAPKKKAAVKKKATVKKAGVKKAGVKKAGVKKLVARKAAAVIAPLVGDNEGILDRLYAVVDARRDANPEVSHSARLLSRGTAKVAQKFGEEAVECLIEAVAGNPDGVVAESADVLYHLLVMWVDAGIRPQDVWAELKRREGVSGIAEKAARPKLVATTKIP